MSSKYPIVDARALGETSKRGFLGLGRPVRGSAELPTPQAHQVLVYRVAGDFVLDPDRLGRSAGEVVNATNVSVVDISRDVEVAVRLQIPSGEASDFTVVATFVCCVTDPVTVVRNGQSDAQASLHAYLRGHRKIFELGLDHLMSDINEVRRSVGAQIMAYTTVKPPLIPGITASLASVEVLTPDELAEFERSRRGQRKDATLRQEQLTWEQQHQRAQQSGEHEFQFRQHQQDTLVASDKQRAEQIMAVDLQRSELGRAAERQDAEQTMSADRQGFDHDMRAERLGFARREGAEGAAVLRSREDVLHYMYAAGEVNATNLAELFRADADQSYGRRQAELDRGRKDEDRRRQEERDDRRGEREWIRAERKEELEEQREARLWEREKALRAEEGRHQEEIETRKWQRESELRREVIEREERLRREAAERENERVLAAARKDVLNHLISRGYADMLQINVEDLLREIAPATSSPPDATPPAELSTRSSIDHDGPPDDADLREEDVEST
jgi:hypothetical protein